MLNPVMTRITCLPPMLPNRNLLPYKAKPTQTDYALGYCFQHLQIKDIFFN